MSEAVIRVLPPDGPWETLGADRVRGLVAENIEARANEWGPDTMSFQLKAARGAQRPDLLPYTPIELEIDGVLCWAGRVRERPSNEDEHVVNCQGWQYHLDDDKYDRFYVHTRVSDWRDVRSFLSTTLNRGGMAAGQVSTDNGIATIGWPKGAQLGNAVPVVGIQLDLGPNADVKRIVIDYEKPGATATPGIIVFQVNNSAAEDALFSAETAVSLDITTLGASGTVAGTFTTTRRYVSIFIYYNGAALTLAEDNWIKLKAIKCFRSTTYESGNASILKADTVVKDALGFAPQLTQATDQVSAGSFSIPEYITSSYETPRSAIAAVNAYENYRTKIGGGDLRTLVFGAKPSAPTIEAGAWSGADFADASVSGDEIYPKAIVDSTGPDGTRIISTRTQTGTLVDRQGYTRAMVIPVRTAVTQAVADRFGDLWLTEHKTAPFAGTLKVTGAGIRRVLGGGTVPAHELLLYAGEKIRLAHRVDPDTGGWGRDGRVAGITYRHNERAAEVAIDDQRDVFANILARYGVLVDQLS